MPVWRLNASSTGSLVENVTDDRGVDLGNGGKLAARGSGIITGTSNPGRMPSGAGVNAAGTKSRDGATRSAAVFMIGSRIGAASSTIGAITASTTGAVMSI